MIIDTHCHLDDSSYFSDLDAVVQRAGEHDVGTIVIPGASMSDLARAREISHTYTNVFFAVGVHPYEIDEFDINTLKEFANDSKCVGVGECGLDYYRLNGLSDEQKSSEKARQKEIFLAQIELAKELNLPLIVHIRDANEDAYQILKTHANGLNGGVLHCYNASPLLANLSEFGFYFGIGGVLTFKNAKNLVEILPKLPLDKIVVETDAPYLTPHPHRGERNEPAFTSLVVDKIAEILDKDVELIKSITTQNAYRLFANQIKGD
ncbi:MULTISPECIES: TatD family hydrolase [unclassified Campylobacter]|uniref:TatD family hydrolase n=1 Tax=unclassified Campylobacter TaxID=2593542 RepID=UPI0022E9B5ED|nr:MULTISPECIES: TatD family hydrolase [unclassified Campylobacter]MDA3044151.1 TatD family hydrolase [Campylobacter sp. JMF_07 ED4]MDA3057613.1 TatD family hydrolase [Campylobacter sp. VBCF_04 NA7]MDA3058514.1 TatD family hydrolase [Campylobacter sp. VBCF_05 NA6]MDA3063501.1 TatD family hydrolase [Campylobacter sp. JMF_11 EL3]MDA3071126.1 TatD family hydrolase [Campylobacter sp. VBCF_03 NA9]